MRMRRKPWARPELDASLIYIKNPHDYYGKWQTAFEKDQPLCLELGCGKGYFLSQKGPACPDKNFLGLDIKSDVLGNAKRNIEAAYGSAECPNMRIAAFNIEKITLILSPEDKVDEIYINFCNPWPKPKHRKHRLTHTRQLESYKTFLRKDGLIYFKTDDDELFKDSLVYFKEAGFSLKFTTYDLHSDPWPDNYLTEYEEKFTREGVKIKALIAKNMRDKTGE